MVIDIKDIQDFLFCPVYQKFKSKNIYTPYTNIISKFDEDIHKFSIAYNTTLSNDGKINIEKAKTIFGSLWFGSKKQEDFIFLETGDKRDNVSYLRRIAINNIIDFHDFNTKNQYKPLCVDYRYKVPIANNLYLTGTIDLIKQTNDKVVITNYISKSNLVGNINNDLETIAMAYAFRYIFNTKEDDTIIYLYDKTKEVHIEVDDNAIKRFKINIINVAKSISNNLLYFTSIERCLKCPYKDMCKNNVHINTILEEK